jgi:enediyne biosynthesis protein E4
MNDKGFPQRNSRQISAAVAVAWLLLLYLLARPPQLSKNEMQQLAEHFRFTVLPVPELPDQQYAQVYPVHPSFARLQGWMSGLGAGTALLDADGDGLANDVCISEPRAKTVYLAPITGSGNRYAAFALDPQPLTYTADSTAPMGCVPGDFNEDGAIDLLVYYWGRSPIVFLRRNDGKVLNRQQFKAVDLVADAPSWFTSAVSYADFDGDGHADLFIGNYFPDGAHVLDPHGSGIEHLHDTKSNAFNGGGKHFYLWQASGGDSLPFRPVSVDLPAPVANAWSLAAAAADLDGDLLPELYIANDFGPDRLLHNRSQPGQLQFAVLQGERGWLTPKSFVMNRDSFKGMGVDFGDIDGDGLLDIAVSNITSRFALQESQFLWHNNGAVDAMKYGVAPFTQASEDFGLSRSGWSWDVRMADFDNDSQLELVQTTGFLQGKTNRWPELQALGTGNDRMMSDPRHWPRFMLGDDISGHEANAFNVRAVDGRFYNIAEQLGFPDDMVSRGIAIADSDGDGDLDFVMANQWQPSVYYRNDCKPCGAFLQLRVLLNGNGNGVQVIKGRAAGLTAYFAVGAQAVLNLPNGKQIPAQVDGASGHSGKRSPELHFGLGALAADSALMLGLRWRDRLGQIQQQQLTLQPGAYTLMLGG